ncbi:hypothetical protein [Brucella pituitosa]|uniref:hypothetical protein n=1 Tax=Brucella pituitosa TaxID=571256 RepID=UPI0009A2330C|nr:hypothetical protein [Brucella pituitosa]
MTTDIPPDKSAGARLRGTIERGATGGKLPGVDPAIARYDADAEVAGKAPPVHRDLEPLSALPHLRHAAIHGASRAWPGKTSHSVSGEALLREGPAYLIWWVMIAAVVIGYLLFSKVWL